MQLHLMNAVLIAAMLSTAAAVPIYAQGSGAGAGSGAGSSPEAGKGSGAGSSPEAGKGSGSGAATGTGSGAGSAAGSGAGSAAGSGAGSMPSGTGSGSGAASDSNKAFEAANMRMHKDMAVTYSGNADVDFARSMVPHHVGAIEMAQIQLKYGKDPELRKLAEDIIKSQESEIMMMKSWLAKSDSGQPAAGTK